MQVRPLAGPTSSFAEAEAAFLEVIRRGRE